MITSSIPKVSLPGITRLHYFILDNVTLSVDVDVLEDSAAKITSGWNLRAAVSANRFSSHVVFQSLSSGPEEYVEDCSTAVNRFCWNVLFSTRLYCVMCLLEINPNVQ